MNQELARVLEGCLDPRTIHDSELRLQQLSEQPDFTEQLLRLIPSSQNDLLIMVLSQLKNYMTAKYNSEQGRISEGQKDVLRNNMFDLFYELRNNPSAVKLYKGIIYIVIAVDFPWTGLDQMLLNDLTTKIEAGVYFCRQVAKVYEYFEGHLRQPLENFISNLFPKLEDIVQHVLSNFNQNTSALLYQILKTFYSCFHLCVPQYLRDFPKIQRWMFFFNTLLTAPTNQLSVANQEMVARIYVKFFSMYCNEVQDGKQFRGWAHQFANRYAQKLFEHIYSLVTARIGNELILAALINCLHEVVKKEGLRQLITSEHIEQLFYQGILLPLCESSKDELSMFQQDEIEYVRRQEDLSCFLLRRAILDLISAATNHLVFNGKSELMRMVQYCASVISGQSSDQEKEVAIRILSKIGEVLLKQRYFKKEFENLTVTYFLPILSINSKLLNALICELLWIYLPFGDLSPQTVSSLMELIYAKITNENSLVVRYYAIMAFTSLLGHPSALESAKPHFSSILEVYVKTLNTFDHENLIGCLESIAKHFEGEIVNFAPDLIPHLLKMFCSLAKNQNDDEEDEDSPDINTPASASLSTIKQILNCQLAPEVYLDASGDLTELLRGIFGDYSDFFDEVLSLYAVLCFRAKAIVDFEYPYAVCRQLLEGNKFDLRGSKLSNELLNEISKIEKADSQFEDNIIAILKNIIQKAPDQVLRNYPWPRHQQLILALIENQRISPEQLGQLDTSCVDATWSSYLAAYSWVVFGIGGLNPPQTMRGIVGVSLFPWLKEGITPQLVKMIANSIDDEDDDEDLIAENTAQLLEKYANEQEEDEEDYEESSGTNYCYLYDSPFSCSQDAQLLKNHVRALSQQAAIELANNLTPSYRRKLQTLMNEP